MDKHGKLLSWIDSQSDRMRSLVVEWCNINSGSRNLEGLARLSSALKKPFGTLGEIREIELPPQQIIDERGNLITLPLGKVLGVEKRPQASLRAFLCIHMDTVYAADDPFQRVEQTDANTLRGPGVVDAKGGLAVMLVTLEALERSGAADSLGWELLINPDEEIGSPGSAGLFSDAAKRNHLGLLFEPALPDGAMVDRRKGSGNFSLVIRGKAAHAGRDFHSGRSAVLAASDFVVKAHGINGRMGDVTVNVGRIDGGGPVNVVPDLAIVRFNARVTSRQEQQEVQQEVTKIAAEVAARHQVTADLHGHFTSPPKMIDGKTRALMQHIEQCGKELGIPINWRSSGGASDGNKLADAGLPVIDTFGSRGGNLHSPQEYLLLDSLTERAKLATLLLLKYATREFAS